MSLSSLIVQREVATMRQVEEALARQVIYGGDLVTNLLEVARVDETVLTLLLAESMGLPPAPPGELPAPADSVRALLPLELAFERLIVPIEVRQDVLVLAVAEPLGADAKDQLAFALGMQIEQCAAPAVRVWQAIARTYGAPLERRMQRLIGRLMGDPAVAGPSIPPMLDASPPVPAVRPRSVPPPRPSTPATTIAGAGSMRPAPGRRVTLTSFPATRGGAAAPALAPAMPSAAVAPAAPESEPNLAETRAGLVQRVAAPAARSSRRRRGPLTFEAARHDADEAVDRDELLSLFFDFSRQFFEYAAVFLVQGDIAEGRDGFGSGATRERVLGIGVPLDLPSLLARARDTRVPVMSQGTADGLDAALLVDLQRPKNAEIVVVPLVVRTRTVALLVGDWGDAGLDREAVHHITAFCGVVSKAFERIIVRRKLEGFVAGSRSGSVGRVAVPPVAPESALASADALSETELQDDRVVPQKPVLSKPPPAVAAAVRKISNPPIPREDPADDEAASPANVAPLSVEPEREAGPEAGPEVADGEPPSSAVVVPPHRPPSSRAGTNDGLPSVIVDMEQELATVVDRLLAGEIDEPGEAELLRQGERAMRVLMGRFPGPIAFERTRLATMTNPPRASDCGPLLRLIAHERKVALPFVLERMHDPDPEARGWATHLLSELPYLEALPALLAALQDEDAATRASAALAISVMARSFGEQVIAALADLGRAVEPAERIAAARGAGEVREAALVPELIRLLGDTNRAVGAAAHDALVRTTRQDFGADARGWNRWWNQNTGRHRLEWLIDALSHEAADVRRAAGEELRGLSRQYFGYASDLPARDRERAQQRYRDWWITEGRQGRRRA